MRRNSFCLTWICFFKETSKYPLFSLFLYHYYRRLKLFQFSIRSVWSHSSSPYIHLILSRIFQRISHYVRTLTHIQLLNYITSINIIDFIFILSLLLYFSLNTHYDWLINMDDIVACKCSYTYPWHHLQLSVIVERSKECVRWLATVYIQRILRTALARLICVKVSLQVHLLLLHSIY